MVVYAEILSLERHQYSSGEFTPASTYLDFQVSYPKDQNVKLYDPDTLYFGRNRCCLVCVNSV